MDVITHFQLMSKPTGSTCNIQCDYCYYLEKEKINPSNSLTMSDETLDNYVKQTIMSQNVDIIDFIWQGGEPTLAGIEFYEKAIRLQNKYRNGKEINNYFQTNGVIINQQWAELFKKHDFLIGISIDGDREFNDQYRRTRSGSGSIDKILRGIELLKNNRVEFNTLTVVNNKNFSDPLRVYRFLKSIGSQYMQFIPLVERERNSTSDGDLHLVDPEFQAECKVSDWSLQPEDFGRFLNTIFDEWFSRDIGKVFVMNFEETMTKKYSAKSSCVINEYCGANLIVEKNGDIFSCDHFVFPDHRLGNINEVNLFDLVNSKQQLEFSKRKLTNMAKECQSCEYLKLCNGGCQKHRFLQAKNGMMNKNYFCDSYKVYHQHCLPRMEYLLTKI
ncbi:anaerobic sulfatase maturase [Klebsiella michiganensis]|uniref:anaerobic sulfatase maturase n=1 Tax=Klebsiella TaxID=570 RepID=UPI000DE5F157|nr:MULTISPECIES: anaerobic sulfatase maturase [Klebsiella]MEB6370936.1 anaerobic sulfatase maturase [Klebsiella michiganensis]UXO79608.1 anaerobic sulfatase maturase [Klebsiella michiganensis]SSG25515.1 arylsulfatase-activating protein aslB [Klebsiella pneumoniae]HBZ7326263.1 anaerobic sulfatase maturase [Klebsiella pneumoniae]HBZ7351968.1 anaerobic sulfatase maturase [Klebsiella pneumoniae]